MVLSAQMNAVIFRTSVLAVTVKTPPAFSHTTTPALIHRRPSWSSLTAWWSMCKRAYSPTIALKTASHAARQQDSTINQDVCVLERMVFFRWWIDFHQTPALTMWSEVMNGWLTWQGYAANEFLVTQKARRVGVCRGEGREQHLHYSVIYIFNIYCFYWLNGGVEGSGSVWVTETTHKMNHRVKTFSFSLSLDQSWILHLLLSTAPKPLCVHDPLCPHQRSDSTGHLFRCWQWPT